MQGIRVGCCGWPIAKAAYFKEFGVVELQDTFYQPPAPALAARWKALAPPEFHFCLKAWQVITHRASSPTYRRLKTPVDAPACGAFQPTDQVRAAWQTTLEVARVLDATAIVFQCPASFSPEPENVRNLERFFAGIEREGRIIAWEPRGAWPAELVASLCASLDLVHCTDPFVAEPVRTPVLYLRLHGRGGYRYRYTDDELAWLRSFIRGRSGYVLFNNVYMRDDALRFWQDCARLHF